LNNDEKAGGNAGFFVGRKSFRPSWPGLTRPSIFFATLFRRLKDTRVKPAYDEFSQVAAALTDQ
jgi:hypothetical protein